MSKLTESELKTITNQIQKKFPFKQPQKKPIPVRTAIYLLRMSRFYSCCIIRKSTLNFINVDKEDFKLSIENYILHKMKNKCYKNLFPDDKLEIYGISYKECDDGNLRVDTQYNHSKPFKFFIDKSTLCIIYNIDNDDNNDYQKLKIEFYGLNAKSHMKKIKKLCEYIYKLKKVNRDGKPRQTYLDTGAVKANCISLKLLKDVVIKKESIDLIMDHIYNIVYLGELYHKYEITQKLGILLYGKPGTGKTSIIKAIMNETIIMNEYCNRSVNCSSVDVSLSLKELRERLTHISERADRYICDVVHIIVIEEIDAIINESRDKDISESNSKIKLLLEFLDGFSTPTAEGIIILASTNYYERLDPALMRAGRFDLKIELKDFDKDQVKEMLAKFNLSEDVKLFNGKAIDEIDDFGSINPVVLRNMIVDYLATEYKKETKGE